MDWLADNLAAIMFVTMFFVIFCGFPVAFVLGGTGLIFGLIGWSLGIFPLISLQSILLRMWGGVAADPVLVSIPMFIFMGTLLERSGTSKNMLDATQLLLRGVPGGLAVTVVVIGANDSRRADQHGRHLGRPVLPDLAAASARTRLSRRSSRLARSLPRARSAS